MKFFVTSSNVHTLKLRGGSVLPVRPRQEGMLVGGSKTMDIEAAAHAASRLYVVVDTAGIPILRGGKQIVYETSGPAQAAKRAFGGYNRSMKWKPYGGPSGAYGGKEGDVDLTTHLQKYPVDIGREYMNVFSTIDPVAIHRSMLVRVAPIGGGAMRSYMCKHVPNTSPNLMELRGGMVVTAVATYVPADAHVPADTLLMEAV